MLLNFFFSSLVIAGIGKIWGKLQKDFPVLRDIIKNKLPNLVAKVLTCSFCFTFWLSLLFVGFFNPLHDWLPPLKLDISDNLSAGVSLFFSWVIVGTGSWFVRFIIDELQLLVHYQNHILKEKSGHK